MFINLLEEIPDIMVAEEDTLSTFSSFTADDDNLVEFVDDKEPLIVDTADVDVDSESFNTLPLEMQVSFILF